MRLLLVEDDPMIGAGVQRGALTLRGHGSEDVRGGAGAGAHVGDRSCRPC